MSRLYTICLLAVVLGLCSCDKAKHVPLAIPEEGEALSPLLQAALDQRNAKYMERADKRCREDAYQRAVKYVDSIIIGELEIGRLPQDFPDRPQRPELPEDIILDDSTAIEPVSDPL